jgi:hypothetical protein
MMSDSFLSDAGWLFFAAWSVVIGAVSIAAFGHDLLPSKARLFSLQKAGLQKTPSYDPLVSGNSSSSLAVFPSDSLLPAAHK